MNVVGRQEEYSQLNKSICIAMGPPRKKKGQARLHTYSMGPNGRDPASERWDTRPLAQEPKGDLRLRQDMQNIKKVEKSGNTLSHSTKLGGDMLGRTRSGFRSMIENRPWAPARPDALRQCRV